MKYPHINQSGIAHIALIGVILVVAVVGFAAGNVYNTQQKRKESARQAAAEEAKKAQELAIKEQADEEKKTVEVPATEQEEKPAPVPAPTPKPAPAPAPKPPAPTITKFTIPTTLATVGTDSVVLTASLGGMYSGTCEAMVKWEDGSNAQWFKQTFGSSDKCSVIVPREKLTGQSKWKFYMYYYNDPKNITVKGSSGGNLFTLE